jgi:hypothetical protein
MRRNNMEMVYGKLNNESPKVRFDTGGESARNFHESPYRNEYSNRYFRKTFIPV